jgi:hypothetical protein
MRSPRYRVRCIGRPSKRIAPCGWRGYRHASLDCECYEDWASYCRPTGPGPGCPSGVVWPCPRCKGAVTGHYVAPRESALDAQVTAGLGIGEPS